MEKGELWGQTWTWRARGIQEREDRGLNQEHRGPLPLTSRKLGDEWELSFWDHGNNLIMGGQRDRKRGKEGRKYSCRYL